MIALQVCTPTPLEEFFDWLGSKLKQATKRARKRWRKRAAAPKTPRRKPRPNKQVARPAAANVVRFPKRRLGGMHR
jgi:hypothetical protein